MKMKLLTGSMLLMGMLSFPAMVSGTEVLIGVSSATTSVEEQIEGSSQVRKKEPKAEDAPETELETEKQEPQPKNGWKVAIDPGHQGSWVDMSAPEPSAPGSSVTKARATTGTTGRYSGLNEYELNLGVSLVLREELQMRGYDVVMTREDNDTAISNKERAELAANENADILVRIHANGSDNEGVAGALTMVPSRENPYVGYMFEDCYELGDLILTEYCNATGFGNLGVGYYDDMSGINWSTIPVTILEMGFMSNPGDDMAMAEEDFWPVMADGIANGIDRYFSTREVTVVREGEETETEKAAEQTAEKKNKKDKKNKKKKTAETETEMKADEQAVKAMKALHEELVESMAVKAAGGENWSAATVDLQSEETCLVNDQKMQAASLIKLYIAGAVMSVMTRSVSGREKNM